MIASDYFQKNRIPPQAGALASRLHDVLKLLLEMQQTRAKFDMNVLAKWEKQRERIKRVFEIALKIKTTALLSGNVYEVILPACDDAFDEILMRVEGGSAVTEPNVVQFTVAPGLRGFDCERQQVDFNSFRAPGSSMEQEYDLVRQALVIA